MTSTSSDIAADTCGNRSTAVLSEHLVVLPGRRYDISHVDVPRVSTGSAPKDEVTYHVGTALDEFVLLALEAGITSSQLEEMLAEAFERAADESNDA